MKQLAHPGGASPTHGRAAPLFSRPPLLFPVFFEYVSEEGSVCERECAVCLTPRLRICSSALSAYTHERRRTTEPDVTC